MITSQNYVEVRRGWRAAQGDCIAAVITDREHIMRDGPGSKTQNEIHLFLSIFGSVGPLSGPHPAVNNDIIWRQNPPDIRVLASPTAHRPTRVLMHHAFRDWSTIRNQRSISNSLLFDPHRWVHLLLFKRDVPKPTRNVQVPSRCDCRQACFCARHQQTITLSAKLMSSLWPLSTAAATCQHNYSNEVFKSTAPAEHPAWYQLPPGNRAWRV